MGSDDSETEKRDRVLAPDDLDITKQPEVAEIDDGRYVVSPSGPVKKPDQDLLENPDWLDDTDNGDDVSDGTASRPDEKSPQADSTRRQEPTSHQPTSQGQPSTTHPPAKEQSTPQGSGESGSAAAGQSPSRSQQPPAGDQPAPSSQQSSTAEESTPSSQQSSTTDQSTPRDQSGGSSTPHPESDELAAHDQPPVEPPAVELTNENVSKFLAKSLAQSSGDYGFDATVNIEGQVNRGRMTSDDIGETLETLLRWYARQTTDEVEPESVLGIILAGSDLAVEYPVQSAYAAIKRHGLGPDDSIGDLLSAIRKEGSFTVPPSTD